MTQRDPAVERAINRCATLMQLKRQAATVERELHAAVARLTPEQLAEYAQATEAVYQAQPGMTDGMMPEPWSSSTDRATLRNLEAIARFACPFCGAVKGAGCTRVEATYSPPLPPLRQPHEPRLRLLAEGGNDYVVAAATAEGDFEFRVKALDASAALFLAGYVARARGIELMTVQLTVSVEPNL